jgi:hypothetical protein
MLLVVILKSKVDDLDVSLIDTESKPPVLGDRQTPNAPPIPSELMRLPIRYRPQFLFASHVLQEGNHSTQLWRDDGRKTRGIIFLDEPSQPFVDDVSDPHALA